MVEAMAKAVKLKRTAIAALLLRVALNFRILSSKQASYFLCREVTSLKPLPV